MTTPANRAPKFVVLTAEGLHCGSYATEQEARNNMLTSDCTVHPIGPALPAKESMGSIAAGAYASGPRNPEAAWANVAAAVIAAHEAGREWETVTRWAVRRTTDGLWANGIVWGPKKERALYATPTHAEYGRLGNERLVRITTRRRRVVK